MKGGDCTAGVRTLPLILGARRTSPLLLLINSALWPLLSGTAERAISMGIWLVLYMDRHASYTSESDESPTSLDLFADGEWMLAILTLTAFGMI
ncbi:MAG: hypothetical protein JW986_00350 [Methanotrichaceae archaeon]|nr:hypothetical protein [Methanotrichaceae archaeon]